MLPNKVTNEILPHNVTSEMLPHSETILKCYYTM